MQIFNWASKKPFNLLYLIHEESRIKYKLTNLKIHHTFEISHYHNRKQADIWACKIYETKI